VIEHALVPMDESPMARRALEFALEAHSEATVTVLFVANYVDESYGAEMLLGPETLRERVDDRDERIFDGARETAAEYDATVETATEYGDPTRVITQYAEDHAVDVIVMGSHGRSLVSRVLLGDVADTVVRRAPVPVTIVR
jgi:nucleotide-binding universal stress UspA family protein